jgi:hypothetical protein
MNDQEPSNTNRVADVQAYRCNWSAGVHARHPCLGGHLRRLADRSRCTADQVLVVTHAHGTAQLLLHCSTRAAATSV